jgi:hypothetical protein
VEMIITITATTMATTTMATTITAVIITVSTITAVIIIETRIDRYPSFLSKHIQKVTLTGCVYPNTTAP